MIMMVLETLIALSFLGNGLEDLREEAQKRADVFVIEAEAGLPEFLMIAEITTESSPDAPLLFRSKSRMEMLRLSGIQAERFICSPSVLADDRENPFKKSGATPQKPSLQELKTGSEFISMASRMICSTCMDDRRSLSSYDLMIASPTWFYDMPNAVGLGLVETWGH